MPKYFYHSTLARNFDGIISKGMKLMPPSMGGQDTNWGGEFGEASYNKVYLSDNKNLTEYYGNILKREIGESGEFLAVMRIPARDLKGKVQKDPHTRGDYYVEDESVSLKNADVWDGESWRKLSKDIAEAIADRDWDEWTEEDEEYWYGEELEKESIIYKKLNSFIKKYS